MMKQEDSPDIAEFLVKDTISLRNEMKFTKVVDFVHPLTYSQDQKKHSNINLIPLLEKVDSGDFKDNFFKLIK